MHLKHYTNNRQGQPAAANSGKPFGHPNDATTDVARNKAIAYPSHHSQEERYQHCGNTPGSQTTAVARCDQAIHVANNMPQTYDVTGT